MNKILILVEGQTEETFVRDILAPYLQEKDIFLIPKLATTKLVKSGPDFKGGVTSYTKVKNDVRRLLQNTSVILVTTVIDFYGLPKDFPGQKTLPTGSYYKRVREFQNLNPPKTLAPACYVLRVA